MGARVACGDMLEGCMCPRSAELDGRVVEKRGKMVSVAMVRPCSRIQCECESRHGYSVMGTSSVSCRVRCSGCVCLIGADACVL